MVYCELTVIDFKVIYLRSRKRTKQRMNKDNKNVIIIILTYAIEMFYNSL